MGLQKYEDCILNINLKDAALILGNGASISLSSNFSYYNLFDEAVNEGFIDDSMKNLFSDFDTKNFEEILYKLQICKTVNNFILPADSTSDILNGTIDSHYSTIKDALIKIVQKVHPQKNDIDIFIPSPQCFEKNIAKRLADFLYQFKYIINLNYDLLVYHVLMQDINRFSDWFCRTGYRNPLTFHENLNSQNPCLFYPHGNIVLAMNGQHEEFKIQANGDGETLLDAIINEWKNNNLCYPLFICEGTSDKKKESILKNSYLNYVYRSILPKLPENIICYGWSVGENDMHILRQILKVPNVTKHLFISIYTDKRNEEDIEAQCANIRASINRINTNTKVVFFSSSDEQCWLKYSGND